MIRLLLRSEKMAGHGHRWCGGKRGVVVRNLVTAERPRGKAGWAGCPLLGRNRESTADPASA